MYIVLQNDIFLIHYYERNYDTGIVPRAMGRRCACAGIRLCGCADDIREQDEVREMVCTKCGARLMETDQFCPKCGARVIKQKRCPDCGEVLRDGVRFCPGCGRAVGAKKRAASAAEDEVDIPIETIERNILSETAAEINTQRGAAVPGRKPASPEGAPVRRAPERKTASAGAAARSAGGKRTADTGTNPGRKKPVYREEVWEDDDWDEDEDWEDDDWDDEEDEEGVDVITIMTVVTGCVLLIVVAFLGYHMLRQYLPKNYDKAAEKQEERQESEEGQESQDGSGQEDEEDDGREQAAGIAGGVSKLTIESNVNVRDQPSTSGTNVLKVAQAGETYVCNGFTEDGDWYEIVLEDGSVGYVFHEYISIE